MWYDKISCISWSFIWTANEILLISWKSQQPSRGVSIFTEEQLCRSAISIKLQSNFIEIALRRGCSPVDLLHIFRTRFYKNTYGGMLLKSESKRKKLYWAVEFVAPIVLWNCSGIKKNSLLMCKNLITKTDMYIFHLFISNPLFTLGFPVG